MSMVFRYQFFSAHCHGDREEVELIANSLYLGM